MLLLPWFLGYAWYTFTALFPAGGIVYPYVIFPFRYLPATSVDDFILSRLPKPLEPLSQLRLWAAMTGTGHPGPVTVLLFGAMIGAGCFAVGTLLGRYKAKPTLPPSDPIDANPNR